MKQFLRLLCLLLVMLCLLGCHQTDTVEDPVIFYYPRSEFGVGTADSVIFPEIREGSGLALEDLLNSYLQGPQADSLVNPFPEGTHVVSASAEADILHITLSDSFASITGVELTVACTALTKTCLEMTDVTAVEILAETKLLNGSASIVMDGTAVLVDDGAHYTQPTAPN